MEAPEFGSMVKCDQCGSYRQDLPADIEAMIFQRPLSCASCGAPFDVWGHLTTVLSEEPQTGYSVLGIAGARSQVFTRKVGRESIVRIDTNDLPTPLPVDATVVRLSWAAQPPRNHRLIVSQGPHGTGSLPLELNWRDRLLFLKVIAFTQDGNPLPGGSEGLGIMFELNWVPADSAIQVQQLVQALASHHRGDFRSAIIPANVAIEVATWEALQVALRVRFDKTLNNVRTNLDYSIQFNHVVPTVAALLGIPPLPEPVATRVNTLRKLRNKVAHQGVGEAPTPRDQQAEMLASAVVAVEYMRIVSEWMIRLFPTEPT